MVVENKEKRRNNVTRKPLKEKRLRDKQLEDCLFYTFAPLLAHISLDCGPRQWCLMLSLMTRIFFGSAKKKKKRGNQVLLGAAGVACCRAQPNTCGRPYRGAVWAQTPSRVFLLFLNRSVFLCIHTHAKKKNKIKSQGSVTEMSHWGSFCYQSRLCFS